MSDPSQFTEMEWIRFLDIEPHSGETGRSDPSSAQARTSEPQRNGERTRSVWVVGIAGAGATSSIWHPPEVM